jgi:mannose/cellobiose epimerase-like protein (N-acyl-D-glucosamine 2-epimerase family)
MTESPDFRSPSFLLGHIEQTMAFYHPRAIDPTGGFFHYFKDDGTIYEPDHRHLVSSTRFIVNYAMAARTFGRTEYLQGAHHGLRYLRDVHRDPRTGGYAWTLRNHQPEDRTNHCYGLAFVLLAYSHALAADIREAAPWVEETWRLLQTRFWVPKAGLYSDEADADWNVSDYRGQNANMHMCEAMLAAFEATQQSRYLERAYQLADNVTRRQAAKSGGLIWEHYDRDWEPDWLYNRDNPRHLFRPWGFQPGHQTEWAKLLLTLNSHRQDHWILPTAQHLFDTALGGAWDAEHGGIFYGIAPDGTICDSDKYFWVQAESLAAAARLAGCSGKSSYWDWYQRIWKYSWEHFVDHRHGAWYRILDRRNCKYSDEKSPAGKVDYHTMGACYDVLRVLSESKD